MYQVRKCDECGHDYSVKTFKTWEDAGDYINIAEQIKSGWHFYIAEVDGESV